MNTDATDVTPSLSQKIRRLHGGAETSFTRMLRLAGQTPNLITLGRGDPDVPTPSHIVEAAVKALQTRHVNYTPPPGMPALREAIADKLRRENGLSYDPQQEILVTCGAQEAISVIMQTLLDPGDEVLLPDPFYTAYEMAIGLAGGVVVHVPTHAEQDFEVQAEAIEQRISPRTRLLVLVSPNNPTGGIISAATQARNRRDRRPPQPDRRVGRTLREGHLRRRRSAQHCPPAPHARAHDCHQRLLQNLLHDRISRRLHRRASRL